jgi:hypothetical protein
LCDPELNSEPDVEESETPLPCAMNVAAPSASSLPLTLPVTTVPEEVITIVRFSDE